MSSEKVFLSYSRRQMYFAESMALHLQKEGVDVWFDLQEIEAGEVWSDDLADGVQSAAQLVLIASQAALDSEYTQAEWEGALAKKTPVVVVIFEPVDLPEKLRGLPTFDFRGRFREKLQALAAYLKGEAEPLSDRAPRRRGISLKAPAILWLILIAYFGASLGLLWSFVASSIQGLEVFHGYSWGFVAVAAAVGAAFAVPLWRHRIRYGVLKRGLWVSLVTQMAAFFGAEFKDSTNLTMAMLMAMPVLTIALLLAIRRSAALLRWVRPGADLQPLRRRVHRPLLPAAAAASMDAAPATASTEKRESESAPAAPRYALHCDQADRPFSRRVRRIFHKAGLVEVAAAADPAHPIALLTNRSSADWVRTITRDFGGKLIFIIGSTVEVGDDVGEAGKYQWVDFRGGNSRNVEAIAKSLRDPERWKQERALETTPAMIDDWKLPPGVNLLKRVMQSLAIAIVVLFLMGLAMTHGLFQATGEVNAEAIGGLKVAAWHTAWSGALAAALLFWMINRGLVYRKLTAFACYALLVPALVAAYWSSNRAGLGIASVFILAFVVVLLIYALRDGRYWFPASAKSHGDEIGIKASIRKTIRKRNIRTVAVSASVILGFLILIFFSNRIF